METPLLKLRKWWTDSPIDWRSSLTEIFGIVLFVLAGSGILLSFLRLLKGRSAADRAVALDTATLITTNILVLIALFEDRAMLLDVALVYSVLSFMGVLSIARYLDGGLR
ncbi:MAG: cation:proton antiporter [Candidatus Aegiribacteria sp.]|nr:cation:proton antiporter [Candidatus Aegiribacteria sp.]